MALIYLALLSSLLCILYTSADEATPLIWVKNNQGNGEAKFFLNPDALSIIKELPSPVKVIAAIGDARVGKSTALNFIHYALNNLGTSRNVEEIFQTGNTMNPVTRGVWIAKPNGNSGMDNVILLDVEGTDLGDDAVTDKLSIFTALSSSTLMLFMKESPSTHILDFLYKIVRLSEVAFGKRKSDHFPRLIAVLRGALEPPEEYKNIEEYIIDALISPVWNDESDEKRSAIGSRFPKEHIRVFNLPYDQDLRTRKDLKSSNRSACSKYLEGMETQTEHIVQSPEKKSLGGVVLDGKALAELVESVVKVMNNKTLWDGLNPSFYLLFEGDLCTQSYQKHIEPLLRTKHTSQDIEHKKEKTLILFKEKCTLSTRIDKAEEDIEDAIRRRKENERNGGYYNMFTHSVAFVMGRLSFYIICDVQLKENITVLNNSIYETIGLRGVQWAWNQEAERLGLSGKEAGVVAQEVELLYPWAVTEGYDGYKRVNYLALRLLIWAKKFQHKAEDLINI